MARVLCIDIGGTRIKAAILPDDLSYEALLSTRPRTLRSLGWLNESLPLLLSDTYWPSLVQRDGGIGRFDRVSVAVASPVDAGEVIRHPDLLESGVPAALQEAFTREAGRPVRVINDTEAWLHGALRWSVLNHQAVQFPAVCLAFGTGIGLAVAEEGQAPESREIEYEGMDFSSLLQLVDFEPEFIHHTVGEKFFSWVKKEHPDWPYLSIRNEYTRRIKALLAGVQTRYPAIGTLYIGGGNAEYISISELDEQKQFLAIADIVPLRAYELDVDPDLIPLLGLSQI